MSIAPARLTAALAGMAFVFAVPNLSSTDWRVGIMPTWAADVTGGGLQDRMTPQQYRALLGRKIDLLDNLLSSTWVTRIQRSGDEALAADLRNLLDLRFSAHQALELGDLARASKTLDLAMRRVGEVSARMPKELTGDEKQQRDDYREMLVDAEKVFERVLEAMGVKEGDEVPHAAIQFRELVDEAKAEAKTGNYKRARVLLRRAIKRSEQVTGQIVEKEQKRIFDTPREAFLYERHRLETQTALLNVLVDESRAPTPTKAMVRRIRLQSEEWRLRAESQAEEESYEAATESMLKALDLVRQALVVVGPQH